MVKKYRFPIADDGIEGGHRTLLSQSDYLNEKGRSTIPLVTVVTVVFNGEAVIRETIEAVFSQTYKNIEYIVIDGGSTDSTVSILQEYSEKISYFVSDRDGGIYEAMNRGISLAMGEYIALINAGDTQRPEFIEESVAALLKERADVSYCRLVGEAAPSSLNDGIYLYHMNVNHQTFLVRADIYEKIGLYDETYRIASDIKWARDAYQAGVRFTFVDKELVCFEAGGTSTGASPDSVRLIINENVAEYLIRFPFLTYTEAAELYKFRFNKFAVPTIIDFVTRYSTENKFLSALKFYVLHCFKDRSNFRLFFPEIDDLFPHFVRLSELLQIDPSCISVSAGTRYFGDVIEEINQSCNGLDKGKKILHYSEVFSRASETFIYDICRRLNDGANYRSVYLCDIRELRDERPYEKTVCIKWSQCHPRVREYLYNYLLTKLCPDYVICHFAINSHKFCDRIGSWISRLKFVHMLHGIDVFMLRGQNEAYKNFIKNNIAARSNHVFTTPSMFLKVTAARMGIPASKIKIIHNTVESRFFLNRKSSGYFDGSSKLRLLSIGRLIDWKGHTYLIDACKELQKRCPNLKFSLTIVYGKSGELLPTLQEQVRASNLNNVKFVEYVNFVERPDFFQEFDMFVLPSTYSTDGLFRTETFGVSTLEAIASGLPVIVTTAGASQEVVGEERRFARVVKHASSAAISDALFEMISDNSCFMDNSEFSQRVLDKFSIEKQLAALQEVFSIVDRKFLHVAMFSSDVIGGAGGAAFRVHNSLRKIGVGSRLFCRKFGKLPENCSAMDVVPLKSEHYQKFNVFNSGQLALRPGYTIFSLDEHHISNETLGELVKDADIVSLHWSTRFISAENVAYLSQLQKPLILTLRDMFYLAGGCHYFHGCSQWESYCSACPQLPSPHHIIASDFIEYKFRNWNFDNITLVVLSDISYEIAKKSALFKDARIEKINNGFEANHMTLHDRLEAKIALELPLDRPLILYIPSYESAVKGSVEALLALNRLPEDVRAQAILVVAGSSKLSKKQAGLDVINLGYLSGREQMSLAYSAADLTLLPSLEETFSNTCAESLLCGTPVVGFRSGALPEMIVEGQTGYLANPYDIESLAENMACAVREAGKWDRDFCRSHILTRFSASKQAESYKKLFEDLLALSKAVPLKDKDCEVKQIEPRFNSMVLASSLVMRSKALVRPTLEPKKRHLSMRAGVKFDNRHILISKPESGAILVDQKIGLIFISKIGQVHPIIESDIPFDYWTLDLAPLRFVAGSSAGELYRELDVPQLNLTSDIYIMLKEDKIVIRDRGSDKQLGILDARTLTLTSFVL